MGGKGLAVLPFIGGVANFRWGTPRLTHDLDLTLLAGFGAEARFVEALLADFEARIPDAGRRATETSAFEPRLGGGRGVRMGVQSL